jgi:hypothetical protein
MRATFTRHLLTFVLLVLLVWYTAVIPAAYTPAPVRRSGGGAEEEEREVERAGSPTGVGEVRRAAPQSFSAGAISSVDDLDWPEFIEGS